MKRRAPAPGALRRSPLGAPASKRARLPLAAGLAAAAALMPAPGTLAREPPPQAVEGPRDPARAAHAVEAAVAREQATRALALALDPAALGRRLDAADWRERAAAADALARGIEVAAHVPPEAAALAARAAADPHPGVRAAGLEALARLDPERARSALAPGTLERAAADPLPRVRAAAARALGALAPDGPGASAPDAWHARTAALARDPDPRVARAARAELCAAPAGAPAAAEVARLLAAGEDDELLDALAIWLAARLEEDARAGSAGPAVDPVLAALRAVDRAPAAPDGEDRARAWRAVAEALALALGRDASVDALLAGWLGPGPWRPARSRLLVACGTKGGGGAADELSEALLGALELLARLERGEPAGSARPALASDVRERLERGREGDLFHLRFDLADALMLARGLGGEDGLAALLARRGGDPDTVAFLVSELGARGAAWDAGRDATWLAPERPRGLRIAAAEAFARTAAARADPGARGLLTAALSDPDPTVARVAFRALALGPDPPLAELRAAFDRGAPEERERFLAWLPRDRPLAAFRDVLLGAALLGPGSDDPLRDLALELCGTLRGDRDAARTLAGLLDEALEALVAAGEGDGAGTDPRSAAAREATALVRALDAVARGDAAGGGDRAVVPGGLPARLEQALAASLGRSTDLGKIAAARLAAGAEPERLARYLGDDVDRRTRVEAAIGLARRGGPELRAAAARRLLADVGALAWDLRVRVIDALGSAVDASPEAERHLERVAFDGGAAPEDRKRALEALARAGRPGPALRAAATAADGDVRLVALRLADEAGLDVAPILSALEQEPLAAEERARLALEVQRLLALRGALPPEREAALLAAPLADAPAALAARFRGDPRPEPAFAWRGELAVLGALAERGRLAPLLEDDALARLDGRFLIALGERALAAEATEAAWILHRAALVALAGDPEAPSELAPVLRARLLGLAWSSGRWEAAERLALALARARRTKAVSDAAWLEAFGLEDRARGRDPAARLAAAAPQARAWAALERGDLRSAAAHARAAAERLGASQEAAEEQRRLEQALRDR